MADLTQLERKLHGYQVVLWLKQTFEEAVATEEGGRDDDDADGHELKPTEDGGCHIAAETAEDKVFGAPSSSTSSSPPPDGCVSKSSVYKAYVEMCARESRSTMFTRAVVGKMVKRAFPDVRTKRRGPRGRVTQHYIGLRPIVGSNQRRRGSAAEEDVVLREDEASVAAVSKPTPDSTPCADFQPTPLPTQCVDTAWRQHESSFNLNVNTYHQVFEQQAEELDCYPGLLGSGEWHATTAYIAPIVGRARHERRHASMGARPTVVTPPQPQLQPPQPLSSSSSWSAASTAVWAPLLPSTLAAMGVHQQLQVGDAGHFLPQQQQQMPLENLESLWDWRHASVDVWQPPIFDITVGRDGRP